MARKPKKPLRWEKGVVSVEFGIDIKTFSKRAAEAAVEPAADGCYSTAQVVEAVFGNIHSERHRKAVAERQIAEVEAAEAEGKFVLKSDHAALAEDLATRTRLVVEGDRLLAPSDRDRLLAELAKIKPEK